MSGGCGQGQRTYPDLAKLGGPTQPLLQLRDSGRERTFRLTLEQVSELDADGRESFAGDGWVEFRGHVDTGEVSQADNEDDSNG